MADSSKSQKSTSQKPKPQKKSTLAYIRPFLEFFIGVFGALAIVGVFFKIQKYDNYEIYMKLGFMGEAVTFVIMGLSALVEFFFGKEKVAPAAAEGASAEVVAVEGQELTTSFRTMMEEQISDDVNTMMSALAQEVRRFGKEMHQMGSEMNRARTSLSQMHEAVEQATADDRLMKQAEALGDGMQELNTQLRQSEEKVQGAHAALERMEAGLRRAAGSNLPEDAERLEKGMKALGKEVHAMSDEMGPARSAVERMRGELEQVVSGHLAEDAERLGKGMNHLGGEMEGAGQAVERMRSDLDEMAVRFRQFNSAPGDTLPDGHRPPAAKPAKTPANNKAAS